MFGVLLFQKPTLRIQRYSNQTVTNKPAFRSKVLGLCGHNGKETENTVQGWRILERLDLRII